jgi:hypothetical protein
MNTKTPYSLLAKLVENPKESLELVNGVLKLYEYEQAEKQQLIAIALNIANRKGIPEKDRPIFKSMTNEEIRRWIGKDS